MIPTDKGLDPVQAAYNLTRKNPGIDWEIEMLTHLKAGNFEAAHKSGMRAAKINVELASAPEQDARAATEHLIKAAALFEQIKEYPKAADTYEQAVARDPTPGTRIIEGLRVTTPLRQYDLEVLAGREARANEVITKAGKAADARAAKAHAEGRFLDELDDVEFLAETHLRRKDEGGAGKWWARAVEAGLKAGEAMRASKDAKGADTYESGRTAFERALTDALRLGDDDLFVDAYGRMALSEAAAAKELAEVDEKWAAFRPMEFMMEAGVHLTVLGKTKQARDMLEVAEPIVMKHWKDQRGPTYYKLRAHLAIIEGKRDEAAGWRSKYRAEFERKERFSDDVAKPIHLEFDEEFYRMLGDEAGYRTTLIEICRTLETGMREVFEGVDKMLEEGLYTQARAPLDELAIESRDQRIWRLLSAYVNWRHKVDAGQAKEGDGRAFEDHMWHEIHPFRIPRQGLVWGAVMEQLGTEEDPIDLYPLKRVLKFIRAHRNTA